MITRYIPAKKQQNNIVSNDTNKTRKIRVCAYARVSTDHEEQESSYEIQCAYYTRVILSNPEWEFAGIYADEGISGLTTKNRNQFMKMLEECEAGKIDIILTKSVSRFARNTLDSLIYIRRLRRLRVAVIFEKEGINTLDSTGEFLLTIMASIAQQESESISRNVQLGVRYHFQEGRVCGGHQKMLGYRRLKEGRLALIPEEAEIVRKIYRLFLDGYSPRHIGEYLRAAHVKDRNQKERAWNQTTIRYILSNPKYCGDLILQRYYTVDVLSKQRRENFGQVPQYYVENSHEPAVPKDIFCRVQWELARRSALRQRYGHANGLGGKVVCGCCGSSYIRKREDGGKRITYRCATKVIQKYDERYRSLWGIHCENAGITEKKLLEACTEALNRLPERREEIERMRERILMVELTEADRRIEEIKGELERVGEVSEGSSVEQESARESVEAEDVRDRLEARLSEMVRRRADAAAKEMRLRNLLERIDALEGKKRKPAGRRAARCADPEEFFERTEHDYAPGRAECLTVSEAVMLIERVVVGEEVGVEFW